MSDDLVERLRDTSHGVRLAREAADRIEELETKLTSAFRALERIELSTDTREQGAVAMTALAELKGEDRE
jgi:hypothetical protein